MWFWDVIWCICLSYMTMCLRFCQYRGQWASCLRFLALLDFVSRATVMTQASVVRKLNFLGNRCMDLGQILSVGPSPPYLQTIFFFFFFKFFNFQIFTFFFVCVNMGPYGSKNFKTLLLLHVPPIWAKLYDKKGSQEGKKSYGIYIDICQNLKMLWHFEILRWESMGKS